MGIETLLPCPFDYARHRRLTKRTWQSMIARCTNPKHPHYADYAGRGITIHPAWMDSFDAFLGDVGYRQSKDHFLDRIDNDGGYLPGNVRWATRKEQHRNKRNNRLLTAFGETLTLAEWAERTGIGGTTIRQRLARGWSVEQAVTEKPSLDGSRHMTPKQLSDRARAAWRSRCR